MRERTKWISVVLAAAILSAVLTAQWVGTVRRFDDRERGVTCYVTSRGISCLRMVTP